MRLIHHKNIGEAKTKYIGTLLLTNKILLSECERGEKISSEIILPFYYKYHKNKRYLNNKVNSEIISLDNSKKYYVHLDYKKRKKLFLMFKLHWYYSNWYTKLKVKHYSNIRLASFISYMGLLLFNFIKALIGIIVTIKACGN